MKNDDSITKIPINQDTRIEVYLPDAPYFLKVTLFGKDNKAIHSCGIDPDFRYQLKKNLDNFDKLRAVLREIAKKSPNANLEKLINQIDVSVSANVECRIAQ